jgi:flagellar biosynthetic protein FliR
LNAIGPAALAGFLCTFARTAAFLQAAPLTGDKMLPGRMRATVAVLIAVALFPVRGPLPPALLPLAIWPEILLGLVAGFAGRVALAGAEAGGQLMGLQLDIGSAGMFDPSMGEESLPTRRIAHTLAALAFLEVGGLEAGVRAMALPAPRGETLLATVALMLPATGTVLADGVRIVAPLIVAGLVGNLAAALASRATPALNVFTAAVSLVILLGGATLIAGAPALSAELSAAGRAAAQSFGRAVHP